MTALVINSTPQSALRRVGELVIPAPALTSLGYAVVAAELSFLAIHIVCLVVGSTLALRTAGAELGQAQALSLILVVCSVNVLMIVAFANVLTEYFMAQFGAQTCALATSGIERNTPQ